MGFFLVAPFGPAIPVVEIQSELFSFFCNLLTIYFATSALTAPNLLIIKLEIPRFLIFDEFE